MSNKAIEYVKIPNRFGVEKQIKISDLSEKQFQIQLYHCEKELINKQKELEQLKQENIKLNKTHTKESMLKQQENVKRMMYLNKIYDFVLMLEDTLDDAYRLKFRKQEIESFQNTLETV